MCQACDNVLHMSKMIQVRNVPDGVHRTLKRRAAEAGMSLSDYLLAELEVIAAQPTVEEVVARHRVRERRQVRETAADAVRAERDAR